MPLGQLSLKGRALRLLSGREHSRVELERKLRTHEQEPGELARILDELQGKGFISDQRVAESVVHRRAAKLGAGRIRQELQGKGLDPETIDSAISALRTTEIERARQVWRRKFGEPPRDAEERSRQSRFLAGRGFGAEAIRKAVSGNGEAESD